jgi:hypothetical protein
LIGFHKDESLQTLSTQTQLFTERNNTLEALIQTLDNEKRNPEREEIWDTLTDDQRARYTEMKDERNKAAGYVRNARKRHERRGYRLPESEVSTKLRKRTVTSIFHALLRHLSDGSARC